MIDHDYELLEAELRALVRLLDSYTDNERAEVLHFVDVGEYGLALETAFGIAVEESKQLTTEVKELFVKLAGTMGIASEIEITKLR